MPNEVFGTHRANIVTYTLAWLSHRTAKRVDLDAIWGAQSPSPTLTTFIETLCVFAHEHITHPPGGQNITEWCKKEACWEKFRDRDLPVPSHLEAELISREPGDGGEPRHTLEEQTTTVEAESIARVGSIPADTWFKIAAWAKEGLAYSLGRLAAAGKAASRKQATQGERILTEAQNLGFKN